MAQRWAAVTLILADGGGWTRRFAPRAAEVEDLCDRFDRLDAVGFARLTDLVLSAPDA